MKEKLINAIKNHKLDHKHLNEVIKLAKEELNKKKDEGFPSLFLLVQMPF